MRTYISVFLLAVLPLATLVQSCGKATGTETSIAKAVDKRTAQYWFNGQAEITSYTLQQARYGEIHEGEAVLIFVTEPFSESKQVKLDNADGKDKIDVLKLNFTKNFTTGIYPYSMMASVFTPVNDQLHPHTLKVSCTSQDWCGHSFTQVNLNKRKYEVTERSYFESEGDRTFSVQQAVLEDEIWNRIRLNPDGLPQGEITMVPGTFSSRLRHIKLKAERANAVLEDHPSQARLRQYKIRYPETDRELVIYFHKDFPHEIQAWEETYVSGWGKNAQKLTTKAVRKTTIQTDYWNKHNRADAHWRKKLELD